MSENTTPYTATNASRTSAINFEELQAFFDPEDIEWRPIAVSKRTGKAMAAAYVTNRAIMDRLDAACGPGNWKNQFVPGPDGGVLCGIALRVDGDWIWKWDGAENTEIHAVKGGLSSSMRRAAVQWGIGRCLYKFPTIWVPVNEHGRFTEEPQVPRAFLPAGAPTGSARQARPQQARSQQKSRQPNKKRLTNKKGDSPADVHDYLPG